MKTIDIHELSSLELDVRELQVYPENWSKQSRFARYKSTPRPNSGLIILCTDLDERFCEKNGNVITAGKGDVVYIPRGACYHAEVLGGSPDQIDSYTLNFHLMDRSGQEVLLSDRICVLAGRKDELFTIRTAALSDAFHQTGEHRSNIRIRAALYHLLDAIAAFASSGSEVYYPIRAGAEALRNQWNQNEKIETYAAMCGVSVAYFYRCFRQWSGKSPVEYRNEIRLSNAETMLRCTDMQIGEISRIVGFADPFYFCRIFAKEYGLPPRRYRDAFRDRADARQTEI